MILKGVMSLIISTVFLAAAWTQPVAAQGTNGVEIQQEEQVAPEGSLNQVLFEEMTLVWLQDEGYGYAQTACVGNGLNNIQASANGPMVLIPNAGDLSLAGSNVAIKLASDGQYTFIARTPGQLIRVPVDVGDKIAGQEVISLSLDEMQQLMAAGHLVWTADNQGPFGNGHGLPGHIAACDPQFNEDVYDDFVDSDDEENS